MGLTEIIKQSARLSGASLVGVAPVERFTGAPKGHHPTDFIKGAKSVISIGIRLLDSTVERAGYLRDATEYAPGFTDRLRETHIYTKQAYALPNLLLDEVGFKLATILEENGYRTLPVPASYASYTMPDVSSPEANFFGVFSHRHAAVRAGLGEFGLNNIVLTPEYGPRIRFASIITSAELAPDPLVDRPICLRDDCMKCIEVCSARAITLRENRPDGIYIDTPSMTSPQACSNRPAGTPLGTCLLVCPVGSKRTLA